jgi:hypothetical protein
MKIKSTYKKFSICSALLMCLCVTSCKKFVEIDPPIDSIPATQAFDTDAKAASVVRYMYEQMVLGNTAAFSATTIGMGLSADEFLLTTNTTASPYFEFYNNAISSTNTSLTNYYWGPMYTILYTANSIIENSAKSTGMSDAAKKQYTAEAKFVRATCLFYLVNLFGDVPMPVSTDYAVNTILPRTPKEQVYALIVNDLLSAQADLSVTYVGGALRYRANRYAASAMLARVYLYLQDWVNAEAQASDVIAGSAAGTYAIENTINNVFLNTSKEVILQILQPATNLYTWDGFNFVPSVATAIPGYQIADALYTTFETGDLRKINWIKSTTLSGKTYYSPYKYKVNTGTTTTGTRTEAMVFLRLSEQYLIRAEARAQQTGKLAAAIADIDVVRSRAGISKIALTQPNITQADLLTKIAHERYVELFAEQGHRWLDLKRTGQADIVLKNKPNWRPEAKLFPIPNGDITSNPFLTQNPGYN